MMEIKSIMNTEGKFSGILIQFSELEYVTLSTILWRYIKFRKDNDTVNILDFKELFDRKNNRASWDRGIPDPLGGRTVVYDDFEEILEITFIDAELTLKIDSNRYHALADIIENYHPTEAYVTFARELNNMLVSAIVNKKESVS